MVMFGVRREARAPVEQKAVREPATNEMQTSLQDGLSALKPDESKVCKARHFHFLC